MGQAGLAHPGELKWEMYFWGSVHPAGLKWCEVLNPHRQIREEPCDKINLLMKDWTCTLLVGDSMFLIDSTLPWLTLIPL
jgi:hypothetical protein